MKLHHLAFLLMTAPLIAGAAEHPVPPADAAVPDGSVYALESTWTDQNGKKIAWRDSVGTARVVALGYATCKGICPRIIADMQRIEKALDPEAAVRFTFITLDPANDGEAEFKALAENHHLDEARWDLLRGEDEALMEMAVVLGVRFNRLPNGVDFAHSYLVVVIGPDGKILHKWTDPKQGPEPCIRALKALP